MGSSGGGGSTSGMTDFPEYMKAFHGAMLNHNGADGLVVSVTDAFNYAAGGNSPYYNYITNGEPVAQAFMGEGKTINSYAKIFELLKEFQDLNFETVRAGYSRNTTVEELTDAVSLALDDDIITSVLPKFKGNLRSIGAVMSSAYVVGEALIWDSKIKAMAKERLTIEQVLNQNAEVALKLTLSFIDFKKSLSLTSTDIVKYYYALKTDIEDHYSTMHAKDLKWDLDLFQYVNNTLSSISGAALSQGSVDKQPSKVASAIGGALSGAAAGAAAGAAMGGAGGPIGAGIGAVLGLAGGLF